MQRQESTPFFSWDENLGMGIVEIDAGHRHLLELMGLLHEGLAAGWAPPAIGQLLRELEVQLRIHFLSEEALLEEAGCPELLRQRGERLGFLEHLAELELSQQPLTPGTAVRLRDAMLEHIRGGQRSYTVWLARASRVGLGGPRSAAA
jgi:hemerythrin